MTKKQTKKQHFQGWLAKLKPVYFLHSYLIKKLLATDKHFQKSKKEMNKFVPLPDLKFYQLTNDPFENFHQG